MSEAISQDRQSCQLFFCLMKNPLLYRSAWPESSREASERFLMEDARSNSERAAPSACIITQQEFLQKISEERATYQKLLNPVAQ